MFPSVTVNGHVWVSPEGSLCRTVPLSEDCSAEDDSQSDLPKQVELQTTAWDCISQIGKVQLSIVAYLLKT